MLHSQIENEETVERYVRNRLEPSERRAFEEHFMSCDECFEKLQTAEQFAAGIRNAAQQGLLQDASRPETDQVRGGLWKWAFALSAVLSLILLAAVAWIYGVSIPALQKRAANTAVLLQDERRLLADLQRKISTADQAEANVPLVMLQALRGDDTPATLALRPADQRFVLWIETGRSRYSDFRLEVFSADDRLLASLDHLKPNPYGALAASLPSSSLPAGDFHIRLTGQDPPPAAAAGEFVLRIRKP